MAAVSGLAASNVGLIHQEWLKFWRLLDSEPPRQTNRCTSSWTTTPPTSTRRSAAGSPRSPGSLTTPPNSAFRLNRGEHLSESLTVNRLRCSSFKKLEEPRVAIDSNKADRNRLPPNPSPGRTRLPQCSPRLRAPAHTFGKRHASVSSIRLAVFSEQQSERI